MSDSSSSALEPVIKFIYLTSHTDNFLFTFVEYAVDYIRICRVLSSGARHQAHAVSYTGYTADYKLCVLPYNLCMKQKTPFAVSKQS